MKHVSVRVRGKVQGVFFRDTAEKKAGSLSINGFVQNDPDGSVYIEAEGEDHQIEQFIEWCHIGPPAAEVEEVIVIPGIIKEFEDFTIRVLH